MKFHIHAHGDRTVGDGDHFAEVDIPFACTDAEYISFCKAQLTTCFSALFDSKAIVDIVT